MRGATVGEHSQVELATRSSRPLHSTKAPEPQRRLQIHLQAVQLSARGELCEGEKGKKKGEPCARPRTQSRWPSRRSARAIQRRELRRPIREAGRPAPQSWASAPPPAPARRLGSSTATALGRARQPPLGRVVHTNHPPCPWPPAQLVRAKTVHAWPHRDLALGNDILAQLRAQRGGGLPLGWVRESRNALQSSPQPSSKYPSRASAGSRAPLTVNPQGREDGWGREAATNCERGSNCPNAAVMSGRALASTSCIPTPAPLSFLWSKTVCVTRASACLFPHPARTHMSSMRPSPAYGGSGVCPPAHLPVGGAHGEFVARGCDEQRARASSRPRCLRCAFFSSLFADPCHAAKLSM